MTRLKLALALIGAILAAVFLRESHHRRELKQAREAAEKARFDALAHQDAAAYAKAQERIAQIDRALVVDRSRSVGDRVQRARSEARRRIASSGR